MSRTRSSCALVLAVLICACGGSSGAGSTTSVETVIPTEGSTTVTSVPATTTIMTVASTTTGEAVTTAAASPDSGGAEGSGCSPGPSASLPDGRWYGVVVDSTTDSLDFDLACWFTGQAAIAAAAEDGEEPPPNDYYVRNQNDQVRILPVSATAPATFYPTGDPTGETHGTFAEWRAMMEERGAWFGVWLEVAGGEVTSVTEQWVP